MTERKNPKPGGESDTVVRPGLAQEVGERLAEKPQGGPGKGTPPGNPERPRPSGDQPTQAMPRVNQPRPAAAPTTPAAPAAGSPTPPPAPARPLFAPEKPTAAAPRAAAPPAPQNSAPQTAVRPAPVMPRIGEGEPDRSGGAKSRKARLRLVKIDPWSVMKTSFLLSVAFGVVVFVAVTMVWSVLGAAGVWDSVNDAVKSIDDTSTFDVTQYLGTSRVLGFTAVLAVVDVVLLTALATLTAFLYNLAAALLGGIELTFADDRH